jgi:hypothetical protein
MGPLGLIILGLYNVFLAVNFICLQINNIIVFLLEANMFFTMTNLSRYN